MTRLKVSRELAITIAFRLNALTDVEFRVVHNDDVTSSVVFTSMSGKDIPVYIDRDGWTAWDKQFIAEELGK